MTHVFLSPHYDDAVYSCGGTLHRLHRQGEPTCIITLMGGDPPTPLPHTPIVADLHKRWAAGENPIAARRAEDRAAAEHVGAAVQHEAIPDCVYRTAPDGTPLYPDEASLWGEVHPADPAPLLLDAVMLPEDITTVHAPLAIGHHVDHVLVRDWAMARRAVQPSLRLMFYEDFPYSEDRTAAHTAAKTMQAQVPRAVPMECHLTAEDVAAKIEGVRAHRSQVSTFWVDDATLVERVRANLAQPPMERYWRVETIPEEL